MHSRQLATFLAVADAGSFAKAARSLFISPTAVMKQINLLEDRLGIRLFSRTNRGLALTEGGKSYYKDASYMLRYAKEAEERARNAMNAQTTVIRVGTSLMTPTDGLSGLWQQVQKKMPHVRFELVHFENTPENAQRILANFGDEMDMVAGVFDDVMLALRRCAALALWSVPVCCAVPMTHPLAQKERLTLSDLRGQRIMMMLRGWSRCMNDLRDELTAHYSDEIELRDISLYNLDVFNECERTNSVLIAFPHWENVHPLLRMVPVDWDYAISFGLLHAPKPGPNVHRVIETIRKIRGSDLQVQGS